MLQGFFLFFAPGDFPLLSYYLFSYLLLFKANVLICYSTHLGVYSSKIFILFCHHSGTFLALYYLIELIVMYGRDRHTLWSPVPAICPKHVLPNSALIPLPSKNKTKTKRNNQHEMREPKDVRPH